MAESAKRLLDLQPVREDERRSPDHKKSKQEKKEEKRREKKEKKAEKKAAKNERREEQAKHWREQIANTPHRPYTDPSEETITPPRRDTLKAYSSARPSASRSKEAMTADTEERISTAEKDINQLFDDTGILFSGMKQMQKQQNYLMQRHQHQTTKLGRKQTNKLSLQAGQ